MQIHIAEEDTKFGLDKEELLSILESDTFKALENIKIKGLMGMATFTDNEQQVRREFKSLKSLYDLATTKLTGLDTLSMGMSGDYLTAIEEGSTIVRIGSSIFGSR